MYWYLHCVHHCVARQKLFLSLLMEAFSTVFNKKRQPKLYLWNTPPYIFSVISCIYSVPVLVCFLTQWLLNTATFYAVYWLLRPLKSKFPLEQVCLWRFLLCAKKLELCLVSGRPFPNMRGINRWMTKLRHIKLNNQDFDISHLAPKGFREGWHCKLVQRFLKFKRGATYTGLWNLGWIWIDKIGRRGFLFVF